MSAADNFGDYGPAAGPPADLDEDLAAWDARQSARLAEADANRSEVDRLLEAAGLR